jgi:hypothetical protein
VLLDQQLVAEEVKINDFVALDFGNGAVDESSSLVGERCKS